MMKFTIVIPTRERAATLAATLQTCLMQSWENLEILVSDNHSQDQTEQIVRALNDPRIRYIKTGKRLSMMENFEFAYKQVTSGYVFGMGDDDALVPQAIEYVAKLISETHCKAISGDFAHYMWPDLENSSAGQLMFGMRKGYEIRQTKPWLKKTLYGRHPFNHLPCIYYGFIDAQVLQRLRQKQGGRLFMTNIVDLYSSVALSLELDHYCFSYQPFAVNGTSSKSNGASQMRISHDDTERNRWQLENQLTSVDPFISSPSIKMMLAEACYVINKNNLAKFPDHFYQLSDLMQQAIDDVYLYRKSQINEQEIYSIITALGFQAKPSSWLRKITKTLQLYGDRLPKYWHSALIDSRQYGVRNVHAASLLLDTLLHEAQPNIVSKIGLLATRFRSLR
jgi:glycosyltransferase involved in cell wall biosynthesis